MIPMSRIVPKMPRLSNGVNLRPPIPLTKSMSLMRVMFASAIRNQNMNCSRVALLLLFAVTGRTADVLAGADGTTAAIQKMAQSTLPNLDALRQATSFESPIYDWDCGDSLPPPLKGLELPRNAAALQEIESQSLLSKTQIDLSPYDTCYVNGPHWGENREDNSSAKGNSYIFANTRTGKVSGQLTTSLLLGRHAQRCLTWLVANGKMALDCASYCSEQVAAFIRQHEPNGEEDIGQNDDIFNLFDQVAEMGDEANTVEPEQTAAGKPTHPNPVEFLVVTPCPESSRTTFFRRLGRVTLEDRQGLTSHPALMGEFVWIDPETSPKWALNADFATPCCPNAQNATETPAGQAQASGTPVMVRFLEYCAKCCLGDWNVVFRNISRQIALLDWTPLVKGTPSDLAARNTVPASAFIGR
jgi:hypothetical protein